MAADLTKNTEIRAINFYEADLISCFANNYGFENWVSKAIEFYADNGDLIVIISTSGASINIINAVKFFKELDIDVVTLNGFESSNELRNCGDINFWVDSKAYNIAEKTHHLDTLYN